MKIRVLLVDDHTLMREGLCALLAQYDDLEIVGQASDGRSAITLARELDPDVVIMDVGMPGLNGVESTRAILTENPTVRVLGLSTHSDARYVQHMLEAGAKGYVLKIDACDDLQRAVRAVHTGSTWLSPEIAGPVVERSTSPTRAGEAKVKAALGPREREVLQLVAEGRTSAETAAAMHISIKTVETHRRNISKKLGLHGTAELTKFALREGLTSLDY